MGKSLLLTLFVSIFAFAAHAQTTVTVGPGMNWIGYMNVFDSTGANYMFGNTWAVEDMKTEVDSTNGSMKLKPNYNTYDPADPYWSNGAMGNKVMEANTLVESTSLGGEYFTFEGHVDEYTLDAGYTATAFIKVLDPNNGWATVLHATSPITAVGTFMVADSIPSTPGLITQYGFTILGMNANPVDEAALGYVLIRGNNIPMANVTLQVQAAPASDVYVQGSWDWTVWPGTPMTMAAGTSDVYETTITFPQDSTVEFKYVVIDGTDTTLEVLDPAESCTNGNSTYTNRMVHVGMMDTTICGRWSSCEECFPEAINTPENGNISLSLNHSGLTINSSETRNFESVAIYDVTGRQVFATENVMADRLIPVRLEEGTLYLISVRDAGELRTFKAVLH